MQSNLHFFFVAEKVQRFMKVAQQKICDHRERTGAPASNKYINIYLCVFPRPRVRLKEYIFYSPPAVTNINIFWFTAGGR
jgi:hypothetical protein